MIYTWLNIGALAIAIIGQLKSFDGHWTMRFSFWYLTTPFFIFIGLYLIVTKLAGQSVSLALEKATAAIESFAFADIVFGNVLTFIFYQAIIYLLI